ncbi:MAG: hypothetical protein P1V97_39240, partial [Planctomycetota bacterium]|nr:hypothetical protein [Planctomycetota bacterium]
FASSPFQKTQRLKQWRRKPSFRIPVAITVDPNFPPPARPFPEEKAPRSEDLRHRLENSIALTQ